MRRNILLTVTVLAVLVGAIAFSATDTEAGPQANVSVSDMLDFFSLNPVNGASILTRDNKGMTIQVSTTGMAPHTVHTVWWVIFNRASACATTPCSPADFAIEGVRGSVLWATGFITDGTGTANFSARLERGTPPGQVWFGPGLLNVKDSEIHIVTRTHGAPIPGRVDEQISLFNGGCTASGAPPDTDDTDACADDQASVHLVMQ